MEVGTSVIYYPRAQRDLTVNDEQLFKQGTSLGTIQSVSGDNYVVKPSELSLVGAVSDASGLSLNNETVPKKYVRAARQVEWYEFWRAKGYWKSGWFYILFVIFFLLFVK